MIADLQCPYCDADHEICHDDGFGYSEHVRHQDECTSCGKTFVFNTIISFDYEPMKADCLNGGNDHEWTLFVCSRLENSFYRCLNCDEERQPTEQELAELRASLKSVKRDDETAEK